MSIDPTAVGPSPLDASFVKKVPFSPEFDAATEKGIPLAVIREMTMPQSSRRVRIRCS